MEKVIAIAEEVLNLSRNTLLVNLRFLDAALSQFVREPINESTMMTDGRRWLYNPIYVIQTFQKQQETVTRDYLHMVFHCVFHHAFVNTLIDQPRWDLACDIAVESAIEDLRLTSVAAQRSHAQQNLITQLKKEVKILSAEKTKQASTSVTLESEEDIKFMNLLIEKLEDDDDVMDVYHNWENCGE